MKLDPTPAASALATPLPRVMRPRRAVPADAVRPTRAEINLGALRHNLRVIQRRAPNSQVWAVLKADGYGHGSKAVARTLERAGVDGMCVALLEEGIELREAGIVKPILIMGGYYGRATSELVRFGLTPVVQDVDQLDMLADEARYGDSGPVRVHVKVDTGMARIGIDTRQAAAVAERMSQCPEVRLEGLMTHFACADTGDAEFMEQQLARLQQVRETFAAKGLKPDLMHAANSAALLRSPDAQLDLVRPGISVFGVEPFGGAAPELKPAMRVRTEIIALRDLDVGQSVGYGATWRASRPSKVATIPMGYADGLSRALSHRGHVLVGGRRAPIVGVVSMDMAMLDVTEHDGVRLGEECVVLGGQKGRFGEDCISALEVAGHCGSIPWEVLTSISRRVPRFYREP